MKDWRDYAGCQDIPTELFFYEQSVKDAGFSDESFALKKICSRCPVRRHCLAAALHMEQYNNTSRHGIWGGFTPNERRALWAKLVERREVDLCARSLHAMQGENVYVNPQGGRECRICKRVARARHRERQRVG